MRVVLAGASGLIGQALARSLAADDYEIVTLVRRAPSAASEVQWDPERRQLDARLLAGADAIVCLSGAGVADRRWTEGYKQLVRSSRIQPVQTIAEALTKVDDGPQVFLSASAVGYYGDTGDRVTDENGPNGTTVLADVCREWEAAAAPAADAGVRVALLRTGIVLADGGLMKRLVPAVKLGLGGPLGNGRQYMPWISITDEVAAIRFLLSGQLSGPINLTGPAPVTNAEFTRLLAHLLHRPAVLRVPGFALRLALGEFAEDALSGQRAIPAKLREAGFSFQHPTLADALKSVLT